MKERRGIPSFPRDKYRYYLEGLQVLEGRPAEQNVTVRFQVHRYVGGSRSFVALGNRVCILLRLPLKEGKDDPREQAPARTRDRC